MVGNTSALFPNTFWDTFLSQKPSEKAICPHHHFESNDKISWSNGVAAITDSLDKSRQKTSSNCNYKEAFGIGLRMFDKWISLQGQKGQYDSAMSKIVLNFMNEFLWQNFWLCHQGARKSFVQRFSVLPWCRANFSRKWVTINFLPSNGFHSSSKQKEHKFLGLWSFFWKEKLFFGWREVFVLPKEAEECGAFLKKTSW